MDDENSIFNRFEKIETDRFMWNPNKGCEKPLVGYLINMIPMPPIVRGKDKQGNPIIQEWECFVFRTTEPTLGIDTEKKIVEVPAGSEVLAPATYQLAQHFERVSAHPKFCWEVYIEAKSKLDIGKGQTMWRYALGANPKNFKERTSFGTAAMLGAPVNAPQLPPIKGQETSENVSDDVPF